MKPTLYVALLLRLRVDAAGALSALLAIRHGGAPIDPTEIEVFVYPGPAEEPLRYCARIRGTAHAGEPCASEVEALCAFVEQAHARLSAEGGSGLPFHLIDQLAADAEALTVYRREVPKVIDAARDAANALDEVAELP